MHENIDFKENKKLKENERDWNISQELSSVLEKENETQQEIQRLNLKPWKSIKSRIRWKERYAK